MSKVKANTSSINIGLSEKDRRNIADGLSRMLADTYTLYLKTHNFHWNVTGPMFQTLHLMFMTQYNETWLAVDLVAERIRALGYPAPGSYKEFAALTSIKDSRRRAQRQRNDQATGGRAGDGGAHRARSVAHRREGGRPADGRSAFGADGGA